MVSTRAARMKAAIGRAGFPTADVGGDQLFVWNYRVREPDVDEWHIVSTRRANLPNGICVGRTTWQRPGGSADDLLLIESYECPRREVAHDTLLELLATFQIPRDFVPDVDAPAGLQLVDADGTNALVAVGNLVLRVSSGGSAPIPARLISRQVVERVAARPTGPPTPSATTAARPAAGVRRRKRLAVGDSMSVEPNRTLPRPRGRRDRTGPLPEGLRSRWSHPCRGRHTDLRGRGSRRRRDRVLLACRSRRGRRGARPSRPRRRRAVSRPWFTVDRGRTAPEVQLVAFPFAGGSASVFRAWPAWLPPTVELRAALLPGRERRVSDLPHDRIATLVSELADVFAEFVDPPFVLFGHSMGATVAYELTREMVGARSGAAGRVDRVWSAGSRRGRSASAPPWAPRRRVRRGSSRARRDPAGGVRAPRVGRPRPAGAPRRLHSGGDVRVDARSSDRHPAGGVRR